MFKSQILIAIVTALALLMLSSIVLLIPISSPPADLAPELVKSIQMHDSAPQRTAHAVWVLLIALICVLILIKPKRR